VTKVITDAIAAFQREISPEGIKEIQAGHRQVGRPIPPANEVRFDAMVALRETLTEEIERRPAEPLDRPGAASRRAA
jgi:hypothetical protein